MKRRCYQDDSSPTFASSSVGAEYGVTGHIELMSGITFGFVKKEGGAKLGGKLRNGRVEEGLDLSV